MVEILNPQWGDLRPVFERDFQGMVVEPVTPEQLRAIGEQLVSRLRKEMTQEEREFIVSVKEGKPQWNLLGVPGIENLPAVQWKLQNIGRMTPMKHQEALRKLRDYLGVQPRVRYSLLYPLQVTGNYSSLHQLLHLSSYPPVEGKLIRGFEGPDVGDRVRVELIGTDAEGGFIDFSRAG